MPVSLRGYVNRLKILTLSTFDAKRYGLPNRNRNRNRNRNLNLNLNLRTR